MDAFVSHSSADVAHAQRIARALHGMRVWLDHSAIVPGRLLRDELQQAIAKCRALVLIWSKHAAKSRWVAAEILTSFHLDRAIIACALDKTPLPYFLQNALFLDIRSRNKSWPELLLRGVGEAPPAAAQVPRAVSYQPAATQKAIAKLATGQREAMECLEHDDLVAARKRQRSMDVLARAAAKSWPFEAQVLNLLGYHYKNTYMLKHWAAVQADQPPRDPLLEKSERFFFRTLFVNPNDFSALNGIGNVLLFQRDFEAAEFFIRRAVTLSVREGVDYPEARNDLQIVVAHRTREHETNPSG